jgi:hypothetical protein
METRTRQFSISKEDQERLMKAASLFEEMLSFIKSGAILQFVLSFLHLISEANKPVALTLAVLGTAAIIYFPAVIITRALKIFPIISHYSKQFKMSFVETLDISKDLLQQSKDLEGKESPTKEDAPQSKGNKINQSSGSPSFILLSFGDSAPGRYMDHDVHLDIAVNGRHFSFEGASKKAEFKCSSPTLMNGGEVFLMPPCLVYRPASNSPQ